MHRNRLRSIFCTMTLCLSALTGLSIASTQQLDGISLRYSVNYAGSDAGELEVLISQDDKTVSVKSISHLSMLAKMFLEEQISTAVYKQGRNGLHLMHGSDVDAKSKEVKREFNINRKKHLLTFDDNEPVSINPDHRIVSAAFPLSLMINPDKNLLGKVVLEVSPKRMRQYKYDNIYEGMINTPLGEFDAIVFKRTRIDTPTASTTIWLDKTTFHPVQIETKRKGKTTRLQLVSQS